MPALLKLVRRPERCWSGIPTLAGALLPAAIAGVLCAGLLPATANQVTYQVNLGVQRALGNFNPASGDTAIVSGTFSTTDWTTTSLLTPSAGDTNVYTGTFNNNVAVGSYENHKFIINPGGNSPAGQLIWESGDDRFFQVTAANQTLPVVFFSNLTNSSVTAQITFRVSLEAQIAAGAFNPATDSVAVAGDAINDSIPARSPLTNSPLQPHLWRGTFLVTNTPGTPINYKFVIRPNTGSEVWETDGVGPGAAQHRQTEFTGAALSLPLANFNNAAPAQPFLAGADMSHLAFFQDRGIVYRQNGQIRDALAILTNSGLNCVRLRLFTSSAAQAQADPYNYTNHLAYNLPLAVRVKNAGLKLLLDFHYSDTWADPGKQTKPSAWTNLNFTQLKAELRSYNSNVIATLAAAGALPDYVQVGNEITPGLLWDTGRVGGGFNTPTQWSQLAQLLTSAVQGIQDAAGSQMPKLILHLDRGGDWATTRLYFDNIEALQVPFDIIGESYYPWWHGSPAALATCLTNAAARYGRPIMVMETAFPRSNSTNLFGIPASTNGQVQFVVELAKILKNVPDGLGAGIFWWGTEYQALYGYSLAGFDRRSFFDSGGDVLPVAEAFGALAAPLHITPSSSNQTLILRWPLSGAGMALTANTNLSQPDWTNVTNTVQSTGAVFSTSVPMTAPASFYRLQSN
jgi:arabinogalactan endo-1,4-beta-galactosidase